MADNVTLNAMSGGAVAAADDIGGIKHQRVKIQYGDDGSATDVSGTNPLPVGDAGGSLTVDGTVAVSAVSGSVTVDGSGVTQPVSATALPLPSGASTAAKQPALGTAGTPSSDVLTVQGVASMTALKIDGSAVTQPVSGTVGVSGTVPVSGPLTDTQLRATAVPVDGSAVTQPVSGTVTANAGSGTMAMSAASLPLPSGAATAAKQPALGTAGSESADVITVQGSASGTPIPISGTFSASGLLSAYGTTASTVLSTELNSLASAGSSAASSAYDNSSNLYPLCDIRLTLAAQGSARSSGATVAVYMATRMDGSTFDDVVADTAELVAVFPLDAATTARVVTRRKISLPPEQVKFFAVNNTGQALAASGNTITVRPYANTAG